MDPTGIANQAAAMNNNREQMAREVSVMLSANTGPYQKEMQAAADQTNKLADALIKVEKAYQGTLRFIGKFAMGAGASMQASAAGATWAAAQFEESFARVAKTTGLQNEVFGATGRGADFLATLGIGDNALATFQNDIRALSTEIPVATQELSYLADVAGTLGVESDNLVLFADTAAKLGAAINDLGSDQAIAGLANLIGAFGRAETEVVNLGSSLADLANYTRGNASEILQFSDRLAGTAVQVNMTAEEVMGLGAAVSAVGARPELGASAIVQTMNTISLAVTGAGNELEKFAKAMGTTAEDLQQMWEEQGATAVLTRLLTALNAQGGEAVQTLRALGLSGVGTTQILGGLAAQLGEYNRAMDISNEASEKGSAVAELAAIRFDTVYKAMQRFGQSTAEVFRSMGVGFLAPFKILIDTVTRIVNLFNDLPQPIKTALGLFAGLGGAALVAAGAFTIFFAKFHALFALIYVAPKLLKLLGKGIEALGPEAARAVHHINKMVAQLERMTNFLQTAPQRIKAFFAQVADKGVWKTLGEGFEHTKRKIEEFWKAMVAPKVGAARESISRTFDRIWPKITEGLKGARAAISDFAGQGMKRLRAALESLKPVGEWVGAFLGDMWKNAAEGIGSFAKRVRTSIGEMLPDLAKTFSSLRERIQGLITRIFGTVDDEGPSILQRLIASSRKHLDNFAKMVGRAGVRAKKWLAEGLSEAIPAAREWAVNLMKTIGSAMAAAAGTIGIVLKKGFETALSGVASFLSNTFPRIIGYVTAAVGNLSGVVTSAFGSMLASAKPTLKLIGSIFATLVTRMIDGFKASWPAMKQFGKGLIQHIGKGLAHVGKVAKWVFKELFVKDTLKIMANSIKVMGRTALVAAKPFLALGKSIMSALGKPAIDAITNMRTQMKLLATEGSLGVFSRMMATITTQARMMQQGFLMAFPGIGAGFAMLAARARELQLSMMGAFGPNIAGLIALLKVQLTALGGIFGFLLAPMAKIVLAAAAVAGAIWGWEKWKSRNDEVTDSLYALAAAAGLVADEVERVSWSLKNSGTGDLAMAVEGKNVISRLRSMNPSDAADLSFTYAATLVRGGQDPAEVAEHVNELRRLAGLGPIEFELGFADLSTGDSYSNWLDAAMSSTRNLFSGDFEDTIAGGAWDEAGMQFLNRVPEAFDSAWQDNLQQVKSIGDTNVAALFAMLSATNDGIQEAFERNTISGDMALKLRRQFAEEMTAIEGISLEPGNAFQRMGARGADLLFTASSRLTGGMVDPRGGGGRVDNWVQETLTGMGNPQELIARHLGEDFADVTELEPVREAVRNLTGEFHNLDDVVRNLDPSQFQELIEEIKNSAVSTQLELATERLDSDTSFGRALGRAQFEMGDEDFQRYEQHMLQTYHHQVGHVTAIKEMSKEMDALIEKHGPWGEEVDKVRSAIEPISKEYAQMEARKVEIEVNNLPAVERVQYVIDKLRELSDDPWNVDVRVEIGQVLRQTYAQEEQRFRQVMQQYDQLVDRREESVRSHNENLERMEENYQRSREKAQENHDRNLNRMAEQRDRSVRDANKNYRKRLEDINKAEKKALEDRVDQQARAFGILNRVQATPTASLGAVLDNMRKQNAAMGEMADGIAKLRSMGLKEDVMEGLGFNDPKNFAMVRRTLEWALSDPSMINKINAEWDQRLKLSEAFVDEADRTQIKDQFDEQRARAKEALDEQVKNINERHREQIAQANENFQRSQADAQENHERQIEQAGENHKRQLEQIAEAMEKLGEDSFQTIDELMEKAKDSQLKNLMDMARDLELLGEQVDAIFEGPKQGSPAWIDAQWGIDYESKPFRDASEQAAKDIIVGWRNNAPVTWRDLQADIARGSGGAIQSMNDNIDGGVQDAFDTLGLFRNQRNIWDPATREASSGAASLVDGVVGELGFGVERIDRELGKWTDSLEDHLNPVIEFTGGEPMDIRPQSRSSGGSRRSGGGGMVTAADGAILPRQATIQPPGTLVQWAEPETGGEAFIPLASSKRERSKQIWAKTGELLGIDIGKLDPHSLHSYADGGFHNIPDMSDLGTIGKATEKAMEYVYKKFMQTRSPYETALAGGGSAGALGGGGAVWQQLWRVLSAAFPQARLHSGYRPGAITATGRPSYHGMGRAIDITPSTAIAEWIRQNFMAQTREMIYSPMNHRQIHNGRDHYYATPITRAMHWDHVHWAMAMGDVLTDEMKRGVDNIPALLSSGEFVMQAKAVKEYGLEQMEAINARRFANGGLVGTAPRTRGREPVGNGTDLVNALTKALANASLGRSETNHWDVKVEAQDTRKMISELEKKKRLSRLNGMTDDS